MSSTGSLIYDDEASSEIRAIYSDIRASHGFGLAGAPERCAVTAPSPPWSGQPPGFLVPSAGAFLLPQRGQQYQRPLKNVMKKSVMIKATNDPGTNTMKMTASTQSPSRFIKSGALTDPGPSDPVHHSRSENAHLSVSSGAMGVRRADSVSAAVQYASRERPSGHTQI